jgi:hypothetical protein
LAKDILYLVKTIGHFIDGSTRRESRHKVAVNFSGSSFIAATPRATPSALPSSMRGIGVSDPIFLVLSKVYDRAYH